MMKIHQLTRKTPNLINIQYHKPEWSSFCAVNELIMSQCSCDNETIQTIWSSVKKKYLILKFDNIFAKPVESFFLTFFRLFFDQCWWYFLSSVTELPGVGLSVGRSVCMSVCLSVENFDIKFSRVILKSWDWVGPSSAKICQFKWID